jgi:hypothetical protein
MAGHLTDQELMELIEAEAPAAAGRHAEACAECGTRLERARAGLALTRVAEVPEPSPFYWESLRRSVERRIAAEPRRAAWQGWLVPLAAAAAAGAVAIALSGRPDLPGAPILPAWSALPPAEEDPGVVVLEGLALEEEGEVAVWDEGQGLGSFLGSISDAEAILLAQALRGGNGGAEL